jgi:hypothetical protein
MQRMKRPRMQAGLPRQPALLLRAASLLAALPMWRLSQAWLLQAWLPQAWLSRRVLSMQASRSQASKSRKPGLWRREPVRKTVPSPHERAQPKASTPSIWRSLFLSRPAWLSQASRRFLASQRPLAS